MRSAFLPVSGQNALLARAVRKKLDQVFVSCAQQVGKLKIVADQHEVGLVEVVEQVLPFLVGNFDLTLDGVEVDGCSLIPRPRHRFRPQSLQWPC